MGGNLIPWIRYPVAIAQTLAPNVITIATVTTALVFQIFGDLFCPVGGSGHLSSIFLYSLWFWHLIDQMIHQITNDKLIDIENNHLLQPKPIYVYIYASMD